MNWRLKLRDQTWWVNTRPAIMGIINLSPDSFFTSVASMNAALSCADHMVQSGADLIDIGAVATNPKTTANNYPSLQVEMDCVLPVVESIRARFPVLISVDTSRACVMKEAAQLGVDLINDQCALSHPDAMDVVSHYQLPVCLMHGFNPPRMPDSSTPDQLLTHIVEQLTERTTACQQAGIMKERIVLDPGFGSGHFGKSTKENFYILANIHRVHALGFPILSSWSHKSMLGDILSGASAEKRRCASVAVDTLAAFFGIQIIRCHRVADVRDALAVVDAVHQFVSQKNILEPH